VREGLALQALCNLCLPWKTHDKNKTFPVKQNLTCTNYGSYVAACVICNQQHVGQTETNFPRDGHRIQVIGTNQISGMTVTKWFYRSTVQRSIPPIYEALTVTFVKQPSFHSPHTYEDKRFDKRNAH